MMQCKDIPDAPILAFLAKNPKQWHTWCDWPDTDVKAAMPSGVPHKLARAKMSMLVKRGLVDGCTCGCRGDYRITPRGIEWLHLHRQG